MSYHAEDFGIPKPRDPSGKQYSGPEYQYVPAPPFKRPRNQDEHTSNSAAFIPMNPRRSQSQHHPIVNKGTHNIFYKTRLCEKHMGGNCSNGEKCTFAHGLEDLHEPPPNWKEHVHERKIYRAMKFCRYFTLDEECPYGEKCNFLHRIPNNTEMETSLPMNISVPSIAPTGQMLEQRNDTGSTRPNKHLTSSDALLVNRNRKCAFMKTKICTKWASTGECPFKGNCHYAHGQSELRTPSSQRMPGVTMDSSRKNIRHPSNSAGPSKEEEAAAPPKVTEAKKLLNWKRPRKISEIYGDWPDGYVLQDNN